MGASSKKSEFFAWPYVDDSKTRLELSRSFVFGGESLPFNRPTRHHARPLALILKLGGTRSWKSLPVELHSRPSSSIPVESLNHQRRIFPKTIRGIRRRPKAAMSFRRNTHSTLFEGHPFCKVPIWFQNMAGGVVPCVQTFPCKQQCWFSALQRLRCNPDPVQSYARDKIFSSVHPLSLIGSP